MSKQKSFTLIELLIVISIIGLLSSIIVVSLTSALEKARDTKRKAELSQLAKTLEIYRSANNDTYPQETQVYDTSKGCGSEDPSTYNGTDWCPDSDLRVLVPDYISKLPLDPKNSGDFYYYFEPYDPNDSYDHEGYYPSFNENNYEVCFSDPDQGYAEQGYYEGYCFFWRLCANKLETTGEKYCVYNVSI